MAKKILLSIYKPPKQNNNFFLHWLSERFDFYLKVMKIFEYFLILMYNLRDDILFSKKKQI